MIHQGHPKEKGIPLIDIAQNEKAVSSTKWVQMTLVPCYLPVGIVTVLAGATEIFTPTLALLWS